jgi:hypothetical protein
MTGKVGTKDVDYFMNFTPIWAYPEYIVSLEEDK